MKRLREREFSPHSVEGEAQALLGAMEPHRATAGMKQRVREQLLAAPRGSASRMPALGWAAAALLAASVAAAAGAIWLGRGRPPGQTLRVEEPATATPYAPPLVTTPDAPSTPSAAPVAEPPTRTAPPPSLHPALKPDEVTEANLLFDATRALRREGDPAHAQQLLSQYARQFPRGALSEEALALSIEAAEARGDGRAVALARRYLKSYPKGHFVDKAKRTLERNGE